MAAPAIKNSGAAFTSNTAVPGSSLTLTKPTGANAPATGDLLLIIVGNDDNTATAQWDNTTNKPTGFTLISEGGNASSDAHVAAFYRVADGTEGATIAVPAAAGQDYWGYYIVVEGNHTTSPLDVTGTTLVEGSGSGSPDVPSVTTTVDNCLAIACLGFDGGDGAPFTVSGTGWSKVSEIQAGTGSANASGSFAAKTQTAAGATGACTFTTNVIDGSASFQFAIAPGAAAAGGPTPGSLGLMGVGI